jgi:HD-GYP domain-containing protein (c-di-GMP phosphodiesterase class II)
VAADLQSAGSANYKFAATRDVAADCKSAGTAGRTKVLNNGPVRSPDRSPSLAARARAVASVLAEEFGVPFRFYDADRGEEMAIPAGAAADPELALAREVVCELARKAENAVRRLGDGLYQLTLILYEERHPVLVAVGTLEGLAGSPTGQAREQERLHKWLQAVADRLRLGGPLASHRAAEQEQLAQLRRAWTALLGLDEAIRNTRIHKSIKPSRQAILEAARLFTDTQAVAWVAEAAGEALVQGSPVLAPADCRHLADLLSRHNPEGPRPDPVLWNEDKASVWSARFPHVANLLAVPVPGAAARGWLIALNKAAAEEAPGAAGRPPPPAAFRKADAAVLMPFASLLNLQMRGARRLQELRELLVALTRSLTAAIDAKDSYTYGHSERVARIGVELGRDMQLSEDELSDVYLAGLLHDIGKIGIRDSVLTKAGALTAEEMDHLKEHPVIGYNILAGLGPLQSLLPGVLYHHERYDGKGYPHGLAGEAIPLLARVLAVADAYDAMSTSRPYRGQMSCAEVESQLQEGKGTQWDSRVVEAFQRCRHKVHLIRQRGVGESLNQALEGALRTGESSKIVPVVLTGRTSLPTRHEPGRV